MSSLAPRTTAACLAQRLIRVLAGAQTVEDAGERAVRELAQSFGSPMGVLWLIDEQSGLLRWVTDWSESADFDAFRQICRRLTFMRSVGLPGTVLETGAPAWVVDVATDVNFPRADVALAAGLPGAVAAPLVSGERVLGVVELFSRSPGAPTAQCLGDLRTAGLQVGTYLSRLVVEARLQASEEASASIVQAALDCVITMDHEGRILDFNPAAEATFGYQRADVIGDLLAERIIPVEFREAHRHALAAYVEHGRATILNQRLELIGMRADNSTFPAELTVTRLGTRKPPIFVGFIRDITERRDAEVSLSRLLEAERFERARAVRAERAAREVAEALQRSLLPPHLPSIAGLELHASYRSGTEGSLIGGDFYDVFQLTPTRWGVVMGDVCGKGPQAASMTTMVRYAIRAAAVRERSPSAVLSVLSASLLGDAQHGEFCTAIYASIELRDKRHAVSMAVGGHPLPLLLRPDGTVQTVGRAGQLLGAIDAPHLHDVDFELEAGELLLFYTDGVTETHTPDGLFGDTRLATLLSACAGKHPRLVAERIQQAVVDPAAHRVADDVALLALRALAPPPAVGAPPD